MRPHPPYKPVMSAREATRRTPALLGIAAAAFIQACQGPSPAQPFSAELELASVETSRNDVAYRGDTGTRFDLRELTGSGPDPAARAYLTWRADEDDEVRLLAAPLTQEGPGTLDDPVRFGDVDFAAGVSTKAKYRFDSYRLTWRRTLLDGGPWTVRAGLTAKIRDAEISLQQGAVRERTTDLGFVPLLHAAVDWQPDEDWRLSLDVDGAWAPHGRAVDASLKLWWRRSPQTDLGVGYRTIEGGADNDEVYTFAWIHQAVVGLRYDF